LSYRMDGAEMSGIFINYRRSDTDGEATHLYGDLAGRFGAPRVFVDLEGILPAADFRQRIYEAIDSCDVMVTLVGPDWSTMRGPSGARRLDEPDDLLREEIARALSRNIPVIPVLVNNTPMPKTLPYKIQGLARLQAAPLRNTDWAYDLGRLVRRLEQFMAPSPQPPPPRVPIRPGGAKPARRAGWLVALLFLVTLAAVGLVGFTAYRILDRGGGIPVGEAVVPRVQGQELPLAIDAVQKAGFQPNPVPQQETDVEWTHVIRTDPPGGSKRRRGAQVTIYYSTRFPGS
jgi:TIR domain/PASTA domain